VHEVEAAPGVVTWRSAQPAFEHEAVDVGDLGEVVGDVCEVGKRIAAEGELPVDQPQPVAVEKDIARVHVVVGRHLWLPGVLGAYAGQSDNVAVENARGEQTAVAHEVRQRCGESAEVHRHGPERRRCLQRCDQLPERPQERRLATEERRERAFDHELGEHHGGRLVGMVHGRRDAGRGG